MGAGKMQTGFISKSIMASAVAVSVFAAANAVPVAVGATDPETYDMTMLSNAAPENSTIHNLVDIATDLDGNLFLAERSGRIIKITDSTSEVILSLPGSPPEAGFVNTFAITTNVAGDLFISSRFGNQLQKFTPEGELTVITGTGVAGSGPGQLDTPGEIDFDAAGNLFISDGGNNRILRLEPDGTMSTVADLTTIPNDPIDGAFDGLRAMGVTPSGLVHFCDQYRKFQVVGGAIEELDEPIGVDGCAQIDFDGEGNRITVFGWLPGYLGYQSATNGPYDTPTQPIRINVRPDGTVDVLASLFFTPYTLRAGEEREAISAHLDTHALRYDPFAIARSQAGKIQLAEHSEAPIRELMSDDSFLSVPTGEFFINDLTLGNDSSYYLGASPTPGAPAGSWVNEIGWDGTRTALWPALSWGTGLYAAPDGSLWASTWPTGNGPDYPTLYRYDDQGDPEVLWSMTTGPAVSGAARGVAFSANGTAFIGEAHSNRIRVRSTAGTFGILTESGGEPLDVDALGRVLALTDTQTLAWIEADGSTTTIAITGGLPGDVADAVVDGDDIVMLVRDGETNRVARLTPTEPPPPTTTTTSTTTTTQPTTTTTESTTTTTQSTTTTTQSTTTTTQSTTTTTVPATTTTTTTSTTTTTQPTTTTTAPATTSTTSTTIPPTNSKPPPACTRVIHSVDPTNHYEGLSARLYIAYFLRQPDIAGYHYWADKLQEGVSPHDISWGFANSKEFQVRYDDLDNAGFVDLVYHNVMCRIPDAPGAAYWLALLNDGTISRSGMMLEFAASPEFRTLTGTQGL